MLTTLLADQLRLLTFREFKPNLRDHWRAYLGWGLFWTWMAGMGRYTWPVTARLEVAARAGFGKHTRHGAALRMLAMPPGIAVLRALHRTSSLAFLASQSRCHPPQTTEGRVVADAEPGNDKIHLHAR